MYKSSYLPLRNNVAEGQCQRHSVMTCGSVVLLQLQMCSPLLEGLLKVAGDQSVEGMQDSPSVCV